MLPAGTQYAKVMLKGEARSRIIRITLNTETILSGFVVDHEGEEIKPAKGDLQLLVAAVSDIKWVKPMRMNNHYATLEYAAKGVAAK